MKVPLQTVVRQFVQTAHSKAKVARIPVRLQVSLTIASTTVHQHYTNYMYIIQNRYSESSRPSEIHSNIVTLKS